MPKMAFADILVGVSFKLSQIFIVIVLCSILPPSLQDFYSEALERELEEESSSASLNRQIRQSTTVYDASGIKQTPICGLNSLSAVNRRKRDTEPQGKHDWPWAAVLLNTTGYIQFCGGTLLNRQYVITAAHCFFEPGNERKKDDVVVRLGEWTLDEEEETKHQDYNIKTIEKHDDYRPANEHNDILLIKLDRSVDYTQYIRPLCLPSIDVNPNETVYVAGWGATKANDPDSFSRTLLDVAIPVVDHETCSERLGPKVDKDVNLCAGTPNKDSCEGDSGGPLAIQGSEGEKRWMLVGIVSWGRGCGDYTPGVYTNVRHFLSWIGNRILDAQI